MKQLSLFWIILILATLSACVPKQQEQYPIEENKQVEAQEKQKVEEKLKKTADQFVAIDAYARKVPDNVENSIAQLAAHLSKSAKSDREKARIIYTWLTDNIEYDINALTTGNYGDLSADGVLKSRKSVCSGFSGLYEAIGKEMGLEVVEVSGYAKGFGHREGQRFKRSNHSWNAIKIDGEWALFDATWGQGYATNEKGKSTAKKEFSDYWFQTDPQEFLYTHFPEDQQWQLQSEKIDLRAYEKLPKLDRHFFVYGLGTPENMAKIVNKEVKEIVKTYEVDVPVRFKEAPCERKLKVGESYRIIVEGAGIYKAALINNKEWVHLEQKGDVFVGSIRPKRGKLNVNVKVVEEGNTYATALEYLVR